MAANSVGEPARGRYEHSSLLPTVRRLFNMSDMPVHFLCLPIYICFCFCIFCFLILLSHTFCSYLFHFCRRAPSVAIYCTFAAAHFLQRYISLSESASFLSMYYYIALGSNGLLNAIMRFSQILLKCWIRALFSPLLGETPGR